MMHERFQIYTEKHKKGGKKERPMLIFHELSCNKMMVAFTTSLHNLFLET